MVNSYIGTLRHCFCLKNIYLTIGYFIGVERGLGGTDGGTQDITSSLASHGSTWVTQSVLQGHWSHTHVLEHLP